MRLQTLFASLSLGLLLLAGGWTLAHNSHYLPTSGPGVVNFDPARKLSPIRLTTHQGAAAVLPSPGQPLALYLGYTQCPDACPLSLERLRQARLRLGSNPGVRLGFITLDPAHDTARVMEQYLRPFASVQGYTGSPSEIDRLAQALEVRYNRGPGGQRLYHTDVIALFDKKGQLTRMLYGASRFSVDQLESELRKLL
jgi:protein SCO1/2